MNRNILTFLNEYAEIPDPQYAIMLRGAWGCGKTFFIRQWMEQLKSNRDADKLKWQPIYVSLYGLTTTQQITEQINKEISPWLYSKGMKIAKNILKAASKIALKYDIDGDGKDEGSVTCDLDSILLLKEENSEIKGNKILIFDDLERCDVKLETLLGYINYFSEHCKCKVIIIGDENKISEKEDDKCTAPQKLDTFGVFFMKYNYEIRLKAVKLVLEGGLSVREAGCHLGCGRSQVHLWVTLFERHGLTGLKLRHGSYSAEFKLSVLKHMHQNHLSLLETAVHFGIPGPFVIRQWERLYQNQGAEGLRRKPQRRRPAMSKSKTKKVKLKTTPHEELLKELEYLRAENAYLKKLQALVEERIVRESGKEPKPSKD